MGGLARRATEVESLRSSHSNVLVVDTGGSLTGAQTGSGAQTDRLYAQVLANLHYDAVNAGPGELLAASAALKDLTTGGTALVSANAGLGTSDAPKELVKQYVVKTAGAVKVGFVGVTAGGAAVGNSQGIQPAQPAVDALRGILPDLRKQASVVVVLADMDPAGVTALASAGLDVQVILGAHDETAQRVSVVGKTIVANGGGYGYYVDKLTLSVAPDGHILTYAGQSLPLDAKVKDDPAAAKLRQGFSA